MTDISPEAAQLFLILKRDLYEMPNHFGYTGIKDNAGRYTLEEVAMSMPPDKYFPTNEHVYFIKEEDAPEYTHACYWDVREIHLKKKLLAQAKRIEFLHMERTNLIKTKRMQLAERDKRIAELEAASEWQDVETAKPEGGQSYTIHIDIDGESLIITALFVCGRWMSRGQEAFPTHFRLPPTPPRNAYKSKCERCE